MKINKLVIILIICGLFLSSMIPLYAATIDADDVRPNASGIDVATTEIKNTGRKIYSAVFTTGSVVSVAVIAWIGVKYIWASAEERADYKKSLLPYFVGAICVFGASGIANIVYNVGRSIR